MLTRMGKHMVVEGVALCGDLDGKGASAADGIAHHADRDGVYVRSASAAEGAEMKGSG